MNFNKYSYNNYIMDDTLNLKIIKLKPQKSNFGCRIDSYLSKYIDNISRSRIKALIKQGKIKQNKIVILDPNYRINSSDEIILDYPKPTPSLPRPEKIPLDIYYEDEYLLVLNKPPGLVVHPGAGNLSGTLVNALISHCGEQLTGIGGVERPGIVHRIDKDTSGLLIVAKNDIAHQNLSKQFYNHTIKREYQAIVVGILPNKSGKIETLIGRSTSNRTKMSVVLKGGRNSITHYKVIKTFKKIASHLNCKLETGRTHQIRVHMNHIGNSILGDQIYKSYSNKIPIEIQESLKNFKRQALHAKSISFEHPKLKSQMNFNAPPPKDFLKVLEILSK